jgi:predicted transcriptional regulator
MALADWNAYKNPTWRQVFEMAIEGRTRELEAGAQVLSGQLGKTIQRLRKAYNLSLSELAEQSGVAKSIISQIERNETNPTLAMISR